MKFSNLLFYICIVTIYFPLISLIPEKVNELMENFNDFSGVILIAKNGNPVFSECYGYSNYKYNNPNILQTKFRIASITKCFTAVAILQLQEKKLLHVDDVLTKYIPGFPNGENISIHNLLTHTSGIPDYYQNFSDISQCQTLTEIAVNIKNWSLDFYPGHKYSYSNSGYLLLAHIIELVSKKKYEEYLYENIFKPFEMHNSGSDTSEIPLNNSAIGHIKHNNEINPAPAIICPISLLGNGDLYSSLEDMHTFDQALHACKIITQNALNDMLKPHVYISDNKFHGYGWMLNEFLNKKTIEYSGCLRGFLSKYIRFIDEKITIIIISNLEDMDQFCKICENISKLALNFLI